MNVNMGLPYSLVMPTKKWLLDRNLIQKGFFNTTATLCVNYYLGHRGQALLPTLNRKTAGLSGGKRASPL